MYIMSGRASHAHFESKKIIEAIYKLMKMINNDPVIRNNMRLVFIPNFNVATCEMLVPAADISQHITTPG